MKRISDVRKLRAAQFVEDAGPLAHPVRPETYREINNFYTPTIYEKGAEVIRMLKTLLGAGAFRKGMDLYFERHDGDSGDRRGVRALFCRRIRRRSSTSSCAGTGRPARRKCDRHATYDARREHLTLDVAQIVPPTPGQPNKEPMVIPLAVGLRQCRRQGSCR